MKDKKKPTSKSSQPKRGKAAKPIAESKTAGGGGDTKSKSEPSNSDSAPKKISAKEHQVRAAIESRGLVIYYTPPATKDKPSPEETRLGMVPGGPPEPGKTRNKWMLHLMRARDPYYPTLMREEFQRLAISVDANAEEAEHLVTRYLCALEDIERHLVKLCTESSLPRIKDLIAFRLKSFYHRIKWDTFDRQKEFRKKAPMYSDLRSASKERFHVTQQDGWTKRKTLEQQTRELAAQVTGKKESTKRPTPAVKEWVHDKMWTLLELEHELVVFRNTLELDESHFAKEPSEEATKFAKQFPIHEWNWPGVSFPDFWKQWLDAYLRKCWITSPPEGKKAQASIYRKSSAELAASAAEFWICNLWDWEPRNCETASTEVCMASCDAARESPQQSSSVNPWLIARQ